ncbi:MAG: aspartyl/glutamyl-tRNA amidotransferase subunit A [Candidatus Buchananbacteria bacterium RBG_13_36_9]|uniref:Glutamyl-tRNA(Gln) amidotransferase subunit A n=1 Tax=Candidatus Buchananbacteria bacterium RBG_13_36_9 TaxID=1797530 RepID=A0A1G1XR98_9BACT|nr:MAG: aspartyl/glutamyl-tRNA amidotransferase subunit A [Candidatus Buchananbacteria bacterium RBG_13_36_9]
MDLNQLTIKEAHEKLSKREISSLELTKACIDRIKMTDDKVHAFLATDFINAEKQAKEVDKKIKKGIKLKILEGIPCGIKDMIITKGIATTASSNMLINYVPLFDATVIEKLKANGAIILGKNNCDAWAHGSSTENSDFGPTHNPWDLERVPGGSSGGSAAAVAAEQVIYSLGTDTGGSIRQPASHCGVVGLKPTYGRVSRFGAIAMGSSLDCIGPVAKTVEDAALILNIIAGPDKKDSTTPPKPVLDYTKNLKRGVKGLKIGLPKEAYIDGMDQCLVSSLEKAVEDLTKLGAKFEEVSLPNLAYGLACYYIIMPSEVSSNLGRYDGIRYGFQAKDAEDLFEVYTKSRAKGFGAEAKRRIMVGTYVLSAGYYDAYYKKAMKVRTLIKQDFDNALQKVDLILMPTSPRPAFKIGEKTNDPLTMYLEDIFTVTINLAGVPAISIPCGFVNNLPVGMQLIGQQFAEETILQAAHAYEQATGWHKIKPKL